MAKSCKVLLDTNFLLGAVKLKIRVFEGIREKLECEKTEFFVAKGVLEELKKLGVKKTLGKRAKLAEKMLEKNGAKIIKMGGNVDEALLKKSRDYWIATNDGALKKKIKSFGGKTIYIRKRAFIEADGA